MLAFGRGGACVLRCKLCYGPGRPTAASEPGRQKSFGASSPRPSPPILSLPDVRGGRVLLAYGLLKVSDVVEIVQSPPVSPSSVTVGDLHRQVPAPSGCEGKGCSGQRSSRGRRGPSCSKFADDGHWARSLSVAARAYRLGRPPPARGCGATVAGAAPSAKGDHGRSRHGRAAEVDRVGHRAESHGGHTAEADREPDREARGQTDAGQVPRAITI